MQYKGQFTCFVQAAGAGRNIVRELDLFREPIPRHGNSRCMRTDVWNIKLLIQARLVAIHAEACEA